MYRTILSFLTGALGLALLCGGIWLASIGGSWFYIALGLAVLVSAWLLFARNSVGLALYGVIVLATFAWAVSEVGFDWWALSARGSLLIVLGVFLLLPTMVRALHRPGDRLGAIRQSKRRSRGRACADDTGRRLCDVPGSA